MKRRAFVKASLLTGSLSSLLPAGSHESNVEEPEKKELQEFYELRVYTLKGGAQQKIVEDYLQQAAIPALNNLGSKNIGVFTELKPEGQTKLYVLIPYASLDRFLSMPGKLEKDAGHNQNGTPYLTAPASAPAYERIESSLLKAFSSMPSLAVPPGSPRIFELRRYESSGEAAGKKKIEMFNDVGEIAIFKRTGLTPVFFGETLIGPLRPNLTYMITFDDMAEHDKNWKLFGSDPEWKRISSIPEYADAKIVSHITSVFLQPTSFSQI